MPASDCGVHSLVQSGHGSVAFTALITPRPKDSLYELKVFPFILMTIYFVVSQ